MVLPAPETTFQLILEKVHSYLPDENTALLDKAYAFSKTAHEKQLRQGGDPYITHPLAVTTTLAELHLDLPTLAAGLLHDVLEDTTVSEETLQTEFGEEVTRIVQGVTKIDSLENLAMEHPKSQSARALTEQAENWRKMLIATAHDIRIILLKLADRKHNIETLEFLNPEKRKRIAEETLTLYAPMAQRLGMYQLKSALEDLCFKYLEPEIYSTLKKKFTEREASREDALKKRVQKVESVLSVSSFPYRVSARPKNLYSIYRKMLRQNKPFEEIQDLSGIRILTDTIEHCYALLGIIHTQFAPLPESFTDYISLPKSNLYQSLHTTVNLSKDEIVEIQIRTEEMHRIAEYGVAAHWRYKQLSEMRKPKPAEHPAEKTIKDSLDEKLDWLKQLLEWQQETDNPKEFLEGLKTEFEFDQVFVFTPKGEVKKLPRGSTPIDFAYAVHTELGHQCVGAKVNDKMARLDSLLKSGDRCQILIRKGQHPHKDWLEWVKTPRAKSKIRKFFRESEP